MQRRDCGFTLTNMAKKTQIQFSPPREVAFGDQCAPSDEIGFGHAFPDLTRYQSRFYLAYRTAPSHFPSRRSRVHIYTSIRADEWRPDHSITCGLDIRDPQFLQFNGALYLFFMTHSMRVFKHEPVQIYYIKKTNAGWGDPVALQIEQSGFWNIKARDGRVYMSIYTRNGEKHRRVKRHFSLVASKDLTNWEPIFVSPITRERLRNYQTSESTFDFDARGNIFGTIRSLIYPNLNFSINTARPSDWKIRIDRFKCDGPKLFTHHGKHYLIARRSEFYRLRTEPFRFFNSWRNLVNITRYSLSRKRTALYHFDPVTLRISHIQDLPSHGDTGYSAIAPMTDGQFLLIYYSSPIHAGRDDTWLRGQFAGNTRLYQTRVTFHND